MKKILTIAFVALLIIATNASAGLSDIVDSFTSSFSHQRSSGERFPIVTLQGKEKPIQLRSLNVSVEISGPVAQTSYEMVFYNPNDRILEGELKLPLLEGQKVVGYALDIDGVYRESVVVNKAKAKQVYENVIR